MKSAVFAAALLCSFAVTAKDDDGECQSNIVSVDQRMAIQSRTARLAGFGDQKSPAIKALISDTPQVWTCSKDSKPHCCNKIPVDISTDGTGCFATFPYGAHAVSTDNGSKKPTVVWELRVERSAGFVFKYGFGFDKVAGVKLLKLPGVQPPLVNGSHDNGNDQRFRMDSTGIVGDQAGHSPRVYPKKADGTLDMANECTPYDPTISNTN